MGQGSRHMKKAYPGLRRLSSNYNIEGAVSSGKENHINGCLTAIIIP